MSNMNYEEAKDYKKKLEQINNVYSNKLQTFEKSEMGLTPDHVKASPEWKNIKNKFERSFAELRNFNQWFTKTFKKEISQDRKKKYINK